MGVNWVKVPGWPISYFWTLQRGGLQKWRKNSLKSESICQVSLSSPWKPFLWTCRLICLQWTTDYITLLSSLTNHLTQEFGVLYDFCLQWIIITFRIKPTLLFSDCVPCSGRHFPLFLCSDHIKLFEDIGMCFALSPLHALHTLPGTSLHFKLLFKLLHLTCCGDLTEASFLKIQFKYSSSFFPNHPRFPDSLAEWNIPLMCSQNSVHISIQAYKDDVLYELIACFHIATKYRSQGYDF